MLSKSTQRKLAIYFGAMLFLQCIMLWQSWRSIPAGLPDFSIFYTAAKILSAGDGRQLYNDNLQEAVQRSFAAAAVQRRGTILPFNHPPFEAILFVPFSHFSYFTAYLLWASVNLALLFILLRILRNQFAFLGRLPLWFWYLAALAFFPIFIALIQGQDSILLLFCYSMSFIRLRRDADLRAGAWLGLGLFKFNLVLPFAFILLMWGRKKLIGAFASVGAILLALGVAVTGCHGFMGYPGYVWTTEHDPKYIWNTPHGNIANLRGMVGALFADWLPLQRNILLVLVSVTLFAAVTYCWHSAWLRPGPVPALPLAAGMVATVLLSYHIYVHDLSVLFPAIVVVVEFLRGNPPIPAWAKKSLYACVAVLFCSPVYLVLTLRYEQLQIMGWVLLALLAVLLKLASSNPAETFAAATPQALAGR